MARVVGWNKCKATAPAESVPSSLMVTLILCGLLLLLTPTEISGAKSPVSTSRGNQTSNQRTRPPAAEQGNSSVMGSLAHPVTNITTPLISLMISSMQQLDSALRWPASMSQEEIDRIYTSPSPLIEYSQSFRTTLTQISHRLSRALSNANSAAKEIQSNAKSVRNNIATVQSYLSRYNLTSMPDTINGTLSTLTKFSTRNVLLASQGANEFEGVANLTKAVVEAVREIYRGKLKLVNSTAEKEIELGTELSQLEGEILSLNSSHTILLDQTVNQNKVTFYTQVAEIVRKWEAILSENPCVDNYLQTDSYPTANSPPIMKCPIKIEEVSDIFNAASLIVGTEMPAKIQLLHEKEFELGQKRERRNELEVGIESANQKKLRLIKDIDLLKESKNPLEKMKLEGGKLADGWVNLTDRCSRINSDVKTVLRHLVRSDNKNGSEYTPGNDSEKLDSPAIIRKLSEIDGEVLLIDKITGVYVQVYGDHLANLIAKVERIATDKNNAIRLEDELKNLTKKADKNIRKVIKEETGGTNQ